MFGLRCHNFEAYDIATKFAWVKDQPGMTAVTPVADGLNILTTSLDNARTTTDSSITQLGISWHGPASDAAKESLVDTSAGVADTASVAQNGAAQLLDYGRSFEKMRQQIGFDDPADYTWYQRWGDNISEAAHALFGNGADHVTIAERNQVNDEIANRALHQHWLETSDVHERFTDAAAAPRTGAVTTPGSGGDIGVGGIAGSGVAGSGGSGGTGWTRPAPDTVASANLPTPTGAPGPAFPGPYAAGPPAVADLGGQSGVGATGTSPPHTDVRPGGASSNASVGPGATGAPGGTGALPVPPGSGTTPLSGRGRPFGNDVLRPVQDQVRPQDLGPRTPYRGPTVTGPGGGPAISGPGSTATIGSDRTIPGAGSHGATRFPDPARAREEQARGFADRARERSLVPPSPGTASGVRGGAGGRWPGHPVGLGSGPEVGSGAGTAEHYAARGGGAGGSWAGEPRAPGTRGGVVEPTTGRIAEPGSGRGAAGGQGAYGPMMGAGAAGANNSQDHRNRYIIATDEVFDVEITATDAVLTPEEPSR
ncbi:hypothetical protein WIS52_17160 [Pseudonocardia nematodicida]|uniref:PPE family protein n=1 Tax=Pseudonocardia nematodicida TaxID=1206997 RepID=A0ABV1KCK7_9PSEU